MKKWRVNPHCHPFFRSPTFCRRAFLPAEHWESIEVESKMVAEDGVQRNGAVVLSAEDRELLEKGKEEHRQTTAATRRALQVRRLLAPAPRTAGIPTLGQHSQHPRRCPRCQPRQLRPPPRAPHSTPSPRSWLSRPASWRRARWWRRTGRGSSWARWGSTWRTLIEMSRKPAPCCASCGAAAASSAATAATPRWRRTGGGPSAWRSEAAATLPPLLLLLLLLLLPPSLLLLPPLLLLLPPLLLVLLPPLLLPPLLLLLLLLLPPLLRLHLRWQRCRHRRRRRR